MNQNGCFKNNSQKNNFNKNPATETYPTLLQLLSAISQKFDEDVKKFININSEDLYQTYSQNFRFFSNDRNKCSSWIKTKSEFNTKRNLLVSLREILSSEFYGKNMRQYRDWNEEFQNCKILPNKDNIQNIHRIKVFKKTNYDFMKAAECLARAVVEDQIVPLNPSDSKIENCYVFNNLFATFALDTADWQMPKSEIAPTTYSTVNSDIRNLKILNEIDLEGVKTINTCTVDYLGHRVIVQTVIQGILHFDQKTWNCYGSIDDGKTLNFNQNFHDIMKKVCNAFHITLDNKYKDEKGKEFVINGSPEVKGIKAGDGRKYTMDLMRLSPRDANYLDSVKNECCVIRHELVKNFIFFNNLEQNIKSQKED